MYKVFFNDRALFLTDDFSKTFQVRYGLFFKYREEDDLRDIISFYSKITKVKTLYLFHHDIEKLRTDFRSCFINIDAAGGVVKNKKNEYLLIFRRGKWDLPKGKMDKGETFQQAALREVNEETGLNNLVLKEPLISTYHTYPYKGETALKKTCWFAMDYTGTNLPIPEVEEDIEEVRWFKKDELKKPFKNTFPLVKDVFDCIGFK